MSILIDPKFIKAKARKKGLQLDDHQVTIITGELIGKVNIELDKILDKRTVLDVIEDADSEYAKWQVLFSNWDLLTGR